MKRMVIYILVSSALMCGATPLDAQSPVPDSSGLQVVDTKLCQTIKDRVVLDEDSTFALNSKVFLWMETNGGANCQITVTWERGTYTHSTNLTIGGNRWRTWASKIVRASGEWRVTITDEHGKVLNEKRFIVK